MKTLQVFNFRNLYGSGLTESVPGLCSGLVEEIVEVEQFAPQSRRKWLDAKFGMIVHPAMKGFHWLCWCPSMRLALAVAVSE